MRALLVLAFCALSAREAEAELRATLSLERDDNLFAESTSGRAGWVNRLYVEAGQKLIEGERAFVQLRYQAGLKRIWRAEERGAGDGDIVANHLVLGGALRLSEALSARWETEAKIVNAQRLSREDSYLRGALRLELAWRFGAATHVSVHYRLGSDDMRDYAAADVVSREVGAQWQYARSRHFSAHSGFSGRWLDFEFPSIGIISQVEKRRDRMLEWRLGLRHHRRWLIDLGYALLHTGSNSAPHRFRAHRLQALLTGYLRAGVDAQLYWTVQRRRYEQKTEFLPLRSADEYAQNLLSAKLSRPLTSQYGLALQWWQVRNGSRGNSAFYRKNTLSIALDITL